MLRQIHDLKDTNEYFLVWMGQSTARPFGQRSEAYELFSGLEPNGIGMDVEVVLPGSYTAEDTLVSVTDLEPGESGLTSTWVGAQLRIGRPGAPLAGYGIIQRNDNFTVTVEWVVQPTITSSTEDAYIAFEDMRNAQQDHVRVLTPYQPTTDDVNSRQIPYPTDRTLKTPLAPSPVAANFEEHALLLPFTFHEGINGYGISDATGSLGAVTFAATTITWAGALTIIADILIGGYVVVDWNDGGSPSVPKRSWARITDNTTGGITIDAWGGDGTPTSANVDAWQAWIPHWLDNPHAYNTGVAGFAYPSNDMHPYSDSTSFTYGGVIRNRPRGNPNKNYKDLFGDMFLFATKMSQAIGKRVNIVHLAINGSGLLPVMSRNPRGFPGTCGWYDQNKHLSWSPAADSIWSRMETLLRDCIPNAMAAEGNTKPPKILGFYLSQGEGDALSKEGRFSYAETLGAFKRVFRNLVDELGYSPYAGTDAQIPFVQPTIMRIPYTETGSFQYYGVPLTFNGDGNNFVNDAIMRQAEEDEFADWFPYDDLPRNLRGADGADYGHLNGVGEAIKAIRVSRAMIKVVDRALSYGSPDLIQTSRGNDVVRLCNQALAMIGEKAITSFQDGSSNASICSRIWTQSVDTVMQLKQWSFGIRRKKLARVRHPEHATHAQYKFCYVMPVEATRPFEVLPPDVLRPEFEYSTVLEFAVAGGQIVNVYSDNVVASFTTKMGDNLDAIGDYPDADEFPTVSREQLQPVPFEVERGPTGGMLIYTDQEQATLRYVDRLVDSTEFPANFRQAVIHHMAAMLASAIIRGREGERVAAEQYVKSQAYIDNASVADAIGHKPDRGPWEFVPDHLRAR